MRSFFFYMYVSNYELETCWVCLRLLLLLVVVLLSLLALVGGSLALAPQCERAHECVSNVSA